MTVQEGRAKRCKEIMDLIGCTFYEAMIITLNEERNNILQEMLYRIAGQNKVAINPLSDWGNTGR